MTHRNPQSVNTQLAHTATLRQSLRRLFAVGMLLLGIAVVCWGLHDKLSLYAPPGVTPPVAKAKLLTEQERATAPLLVTAPSAPAPLLLLLFFWSLLAWLLSRSPLYARQQFGGVRSNAPPKVYALWRRPPPAVEIAA